MVPVMNSHRSRCHPSMMECEWRSRGRQPRSCCPAGAKLNPREAGHWARGRRSPCRPGRSGRSNRPLVAVMKCPPSLLRGPRAHCSPAKGIRQKHPEPHGPPGGRKGLLELRGQLEPEPQAGQWDRMERECPWAEPAAPSSRQASWPALCGGRFPDPTEFNNYAPPSW